MNLAIKFWKDVPNPAAIPAAWPSLCIELGSDTAYGDGSWTIMTVSAYEAYRAEHQAEYDAWEAANPTTTGGGQ